ncbi:hypothetical protein C8R45DRAFT_1093033 [Mycena sanguinolenta]|nr:hypothetical protein C8R45DRAFT_1093033 [Mycena sanguinolenta]
MDTDDDLICPYYWAKPIHALNCEIVWPKALDESFPAPSTTVIPSRPPRGGPFLELDTPQYSGVISKEWIIEKLLAQAGIRLAGMLNYLFADIEDPEEAKLWRSGQGLRIHV